VRKALQWSRKEGARRFARTELTVTNWETKNKVPLEASLLMKQNCLSHFDQSHRIIETLDQQGEGDFSDARIVMRHESGQWSSNFHHHEQQDPPAIAHWIRTYFVETRDEPFISLEFIDEPEKEKYQQNKFVLTEKPVLATH